MTCLPGRIHYWIIEASQQAVESGRIGTSMGICKHCGEKREFENSIPDSAHNFYAGRMEDV